MEEIKSLLSVEKTANFGQMSNGMVNRVLKAIWAGKSDGSLVQLVSKRTAYGGNLILPEEYGSDEAGLTKFKNDVNDALKAGTVKMYGCVVAIHDATDGEHEECVNVTNGHVMQAIPRAWDCDDEKAVLEAVRRDLRKSVFKGKISFDVPKA